VSGARVPLAGVIGHPVGHSLSPRLHGHWLSRLGIAGHYVPLEVAPADLAEVLRVLPKAGFAGVNITGPHKEAALALADAVSGRAGRIGSANTLVFEPGGRVAADSTDGVGFIGNLRHALPGWSAAAGPAVVFGAGGAARAVVDALVEDGAPEVRLTNRTRARAEAVAAALGPRVTVVDWADATAALPGAALAVNTTTLGMAGQPPFTLSLAALPDDAVATDIVYAPLDTPFLKAAAARGLRTVDGLGMLLHQAVPGFARWFGVTPPVDAALRDAVLAP